MDPLTYRITGRQLRSLRRAVLLVSGLAIVLVAAAVVRGAWVGSSPGLTIGVAGCSVIGLWALMVYARAYTQCTQIGIRTRWLAGSRECRWEDVAGIASRSFRGTLAVMVVTRHGSRFRLGAPVAAPVMGDPEFAAKLAQIREYWHAKVTAAD